MFNNIIQEYTQKIIPILIGVVICFAMFALIVVGVSADDSIVIETIAREASNQSFEAQVMVAQTILTRSREWHKTPEEVCLQKWQYSCWNEGIRQKQKKRTMAELSNARKALQYAKSAQNTLPNVSHYHNSNIKPYWANKLVFVKQIGDLRFYYERR